MKVRQYVYFGLRSDVLKPHAITARLGIEPDVAKVQGSRGATQRVGAAPRPMPRQHSWRIGSGRPQTDPLDDQFAALLARLLPFQAAIGQLLADGAATGVLQVVRNTEPGPEDREIIEPSSGPDWTRVRGQHPLLGFRLDPELIAFAYNLGVAIDFDEYGDEYE